MDQRKKHVREPPSVPFLWELKPGIPKKDWKPEASSSVCNHYLPKIPLKLIASVPFVWEEKPGIPLPNFSHVSVDYVPPKPNTILFHVASSSGYSLASNYDYDYNNKQSSRDNESITTNLDLEAFSFDAAPSLLANCLVSSAKISNAIPLHEKSSSEHDCDQLETPSSPASSETDSDTSSYATGRSSPTGSAILECLFPLRTPTKSSFLERDGNSTKVLSSSALEQKGKDFGSEDCPSDMVRRPATLGELIMMSRRRSYVRKANQIGKWDPPKVIVLHSTHYTTSLFITFYFLVSIQ